MSRSITVRGIVLTCSALVAAAGLAACTPPLPPDVLAAQAESQIVCQSGEVTASVPETLIGAMDAVGLGLGGVCPDQTVVEVAPDQAAPLALVDKTPTPAEIADWDAENCPTGNAIVVPAFAYPVTVAYNVIGLEGVVMTPEIVAGILNGTITTWEDPLIAASNDGFDFTLLPEMTVMSVESPQGSVEAMTAWLATEAPEAWSKGIVGTLDGTQTFPTMTDMIAEMTSIESSVAILPVYQAFNNVLATANLPVTLEDGSELVITADDVQQYKVGSGATTVTTDEAGNLLASPASGGIPVPENFDQASSKIVLAEGQPLVGWPVLGYAHLIVCDDPSDPLPLSFAQYLVRLAGQGALETYGVTPLPEPIRIRTFTPLKVTVNVDGVPPTSS
ncbi:MAG: substrate-binding domain-containing protein [Actinomycetota bacterium]|nr:substrate-binding domain-containing protein [Actinomycetota bacterium]